MTSLPLKQLLPASYPVSPAWRWPVFASALPSVSGVYLFLDKRRQLLYIGKAKQLKSRVSSYKVAPVGKTRLMLTHSFWLKFITTPSELEAILLEAKLIRAYQPKYNLRLKDDKSPLYITITTDPIPQVILTRQSGDFGPFSSSTDARSILKIARTIFPFCSAKKPGRPCFYSHLHLCPGICSGKITIIEYRRALGRLRRFLGGHVNALVSQLTHAMRYAATKKNYEAAANIRNQLQLLDSLPQLYHSRDLDDLTTSTRVTSGLSQLKTLLKLPILPHRIEGYDISHLQGQQATGSLVVLRHGRPAPDQYRHFRFSSTSPNDPYMIREVVNRRFNHPEWGTPDLIVVDGGKPQVAAAQHITTIPVIGLAKRLETIHFRGQIFVLPKNSLALQLLQTLRDESHRFARRLHHHWRSKKLLN